jgi:hypothetical protein
MLVTQRHKNLVIAISKALEDAIDNDAGLDDQSDQGYCRVATNEQYRIQLTDDFIAGKLRVAAVDDEGKEVLALELVPVEVE